MTKKQGYSSVVCFVLTCIIAIIMFMNGLIVHAESNSSQTLGSLYNFYPSDCLSTSGYADSEIYDSGINTLYFETTSFDVSYLSDLELPVLSGYDYSNYSKVCCISNSSDTYIVLIDENSYFIKPSDPTKIGVCSLIPRGSTPSNNLLIIYYSNGVYQNYYSRNYDFFKNNVDYSYAGYLLPYSSYHNALCSNTELYGLDTSAIPSSWGTFTGQDYFEVFAARHTDWANSGNYTDVDEIYKNCNYIEEDINGGSGSSENASNNMFLQFPKWYFYNIPELTSLGSYYLKGENGSLGSATFNAELTDYQREHLSEFSLKIDIRTYVYIEETKETVEKHQRFYDYPSQTIPLTTFYSNSNNYNVLIRDIFQNSTFSSPVNGNVTYLDAWLDSFDNNYSDELKKLQTKFTATLVSSSSSNTTDSGSCSYVYDYLTGRSFMDDNSLGTNPNPDFESDQSYNGFDDGSQIATSGGNTLINNDNDTITIESNGEVAERIVNNMLPEESDAGLSQQFQDIINSNGWVAVIQNTFSFVPESVINAISLYLITALGIFAAAFVLRIVLDLL